MCHVPEQTSYEICPVGIYIAALTLNCAYPYMRFLSGDLGRLFMNCPLRGH